jgi:hypothetical protein
MQIIKTSKIVFGSRLIFAILLLTLVSHSFAKGIHARADLNIREMTSTELNGAIYRVMKGYSETSPFMVLEKIRLPGVEGESAKVLTSWDLTSMAGNKLVEAMQEGDDLLDLKWVADQVNFIFLHSGKRTECKIIGIEANKPNIKCSNFEKK